MGTQSKVIENVGQKVVVVYITTPFHGPLSGTIRVSQYQKGITRKVKPIWIYWSKR